jgi:hypothetical protein
MTKKDLFIIVIKLFGLYLFIVTLFNIIPSCVSNVASEMDWYSILYIIAIVLLFSMLLVVFLFNSHKVATFLKLDKGFDDEYIHFGNLDSEKISHLGFIIVGGLVFIDNLPFLLTNTYLTFKSSAQTTFDGEVPAYGTPHDYANLWSSLLSVLLGYLILTNYKSITKWILAKQ